MIVLTRPSSLAPAVSVDECLVHLVYGVPQGALVHDLLDHAGHQLATENLPGGFFNAYPQLAGKRVIYRRNGDFLAVTHDLRAGSQILFGIAGGNYPVAIDPTGILIAWQDAALGVHRGNPVSGWNDTGPQTGAPDGIASLDAPSGLVTLKKDIRTSHAGMLNPVRAGDLVVGEGPQGGLMVQLDGDVLRVLFRGQNCPTPSNATDGSLYAIVTGGAPSTRLVMLSRSEILGLEVA